jgi:hypothetical protein
MNLNYVKWIKNTDAKLLPTFDFSNLLSFTGTCSYRLITLFGSYKHGI